MSFSFLLLSISDPHLSRRAPRPLIVWSFLDPAERLAPPTVSLPSCFATAASAAARWGRPGLVSWWGWPPPGYVGRSADASASTIPRKLGRGGRGFRGSNTRRKLLLNLVCFGFHGSVVVCRPAQLPIFSTWLWCIAYISTFNSQNSQNPIWLFRAPIFSTSIFLEDTRNNIYL